MGKSQKLNVQTASMAFAELSPNSPSGNQTPATVKFRKVDSATPTVIFEE